MSDQSVTPGHESSRTPEGTGTTLATPDFDRREVATFGNDDGHAVGVIGKMLVGFFFYSLLVMIAVAWWTIGRGGQVDSHAPAGHHSEDTEDADE